MWWSVLEQEKEDRSSLRHRTSKSCAGVPPAKDARSDGGASLGRTQQRPRTAGSGRSYGGTLSGLRPTHPLSAPVLLRGDGQLARPRSAGSGATAFTDAKKPSPQSAANAEVQETYIQKIEDKDVKLWMATCRREGMIRRDRVDAVDQLNDSELFDLKVLHNKCQRERSAANWRTTVSKESSRSKKNSKARGVEKSNSWASLTSPMQIKELRDVLEEDVRAHCVRLDAFEAVGMERPAVMEEQNVAWDFLRVLKRNWISPPEHTEPLHGHHRQRCSARSSHSQATMAATAMPPLDATSAHY